MRHGAAPGENQFWDAIGNARRDCVRIVPGELNRRAQQMAALFAGQL
jgi:hypothetical protein